MQYVLNQQEYDEFMRLRKEAAQWVGETKSMSVNNDLFILSKRPSNPNYKFLCVNGVWIGSRRNQFYHVGSFITQVRGLLGLEIGYSILRINGLLYSLDDSIELDGSDVILDCVSSSEA